MLCFHPLKRILPSDKIIIAKPRIGFHRYTDVVCFLSENVIVMIIRWVLSSFSFLSFFFVLNIKINQTSNNYF